MSQDNKLKTAAALSEVWDGAPWRRARRGDGVSVLNHRRVCLHLMIQPEAAAAFLSDPVLLGQGLLSRMLVAAPPSAMGARFGAPTNDSERHIRAYLSAMKTLWKRPVRHRDNERGALDLRTLALTPEAARAAEAFAYWAERQLHESGLLRPVSGFANKLSEHAVRLAGVFKAADDADAHELDAETMERGISLARWYASEALRLFDQGRVSPSLLAADRVRLWLMNEWPHDFVSLPDIYQRGPGCVREAATARKAAAHLQEHGWLLAAETPVMIAGNRRREAWRIVREGGS